MLYCFNTNFTIKLLTLSKEDFFDICEYIKDIEILNEKSNGIYYEELQESIIYALNKKRRYKKKINNKFLPLIEKHIELIKSLNDKGLSSMFINILKDRTDEKKFINLIRYFEKNYDKINLFICNLQVLEQMGLNKFYYAKDITFDKATTSIESKEYQYTPYVEVNSFKTDGSIKLLYNDNSYYKYSINNAKYIVCYRKGDPLYNPITISIKDFSFDASKLPDIEELRSKRIDIDEYQDIDNLDNEINKERKKIKELIKSQNEIQQRINNLTILRDNKK